MLVLLKKTMVLPKVVQQGPAFDACCGWEEGS